MSIKTTSAKVLKVSFLAALLVPCCVLIADSNKTPMVYRAILPDHDDDNGAYFCMPDCDTKAKVTEIKDTSLVRNLLRGLARLDSVKDLDTSRALLEIFANAYPDSGPGEVINEFDKGLAIWNLERANFDGEPPQDYYLYVDTDGSIGGYQEFVIVRSDQLITCQKLWGVWRGFGNMFYRALHHDDTSALAFFSALDLPHQTFSSKSPHDINDDGRDEFFEFDIFTREDEEESSNADLCCFPMPYVWNGRCFSCGLKKQPRYLKQLRESLHLLDPYDSTAIEWRIRQEMK